MIRNLLTLLTALTLSLGVSAQQKNTSANGAAVDKQARIWFESDEIRIPTFDMSQSTQTVFVKYKNKGNANLVITGVHVSCRCTQVKYPEKFVAPGDSAMLEVTYSAYGPGEFMKSITVMTNGIPHGSRLRLCGEVLEAPKSKE